VFADCVRRARREGVSLHEAPRAQIGYSDAELGGALALHWNFPQELADAVRHHPLNVYTVPEKEGSLTAYVVRARRFALAYGISDGVDTAQAGRVPREWSTRPLSKVLADAGGPDGVIARVSAFLESTLAG